MIGNLFFSFKKKKPDSGSIRLERQWKCLEAGRSPLIQYDRNKTEPSFIVFNFRITCIIL